MRPTVSDCANHTTDFMQPIFDIKTRIYLLHILEFPEKMENFYRNTTCHLHFLFDIIVAILGQTNI
jgi:hypothetical protein